MHSAPVSQEGEGLRRLLRSLQLKQGYLIYPGRQAYSLGKGVTALPAGKILFRPHDIAEL